MAAREKETLTTETLGMRKWRRNGVEADCDTREEEKATRIRNSSLQSIKNALKSVSRSQNQRNPKEMEENSAETEVRESLKTPNLDEPINRSWSVDCLVNAVNVLNIQIFVLFLIFLSFLLPFSIEIPNF